MADFGSSSALSEGRSRARCGRSVLWLRPARMFQLQPNRPVLILPELDWRLSAPLRTEQRNPGRVDFAAPRQAGLGQLRPLGVSSTTGSSILIWSASRLQEKDHCAHEGKVAVLYPASGLKELLPSGPDGNSRIPVLISLAVFRFIGTRV